MQEKTPLLLQKKQSSGKIRRQVICIEKERGILGVPSELEVSMRVTHGEEAVLLSVRVDETKVDASVRLCGCFYAVEFTEILCTSFIFSARVNIDFYKGFLVPF